MFVKVVTHFLTPINHRKTCCIPRLCFVISNPLRLMFFFSNWIFGLEFPLIIYSELQNCTHCSQDGPRCDWHWWLQEPGAQSPALEFEANFIWADFSLPRLGRNWWLLTFLQPGNNFVHMKSCNDGAWFVKVRAVQDDRTRSWGIEQDAGRRGLHQGFLHLEIQKLKLQFCQTHSFIVSLIYSIASMSGGCWRHRGGGRGVQDHCHAYFHLHQEERAGEFGQILVDLKTFLLHWTTSWSLFSKCLLYRLQNWRELTWRSWRSWWRRTGSLSTSREKTSSACFSFEWRPTTHESLMRARSLG